MTRAPPGPPGHLASCFSCVAGGIRVADDFDTIDDHAQQASLCRKRIDRLFESFDGCLLSCQKANPIQVEMWTIVVAAEQSLAARVIAGVRASSNTDQSTRLAADPLEGERSLHRLQFVFRRKLGPPLVVERQRHYEEVDWDDKPVADSNQMNVSDFPFSGNIWGKATVSVAIRHAIFLPSS